MFFKYAEYEIKMICDLKEHLEGYQIVSISIGVDNDYYILAVNSIPPRIDGMFPQSQTTTLQNYKVILLRWDNVYTVNIDNQEWNYHFVQPINDGILLACARSKYYSKDKYDLNGKIFNTNGILLKEFLLGDGIQDLSNLWSNKKGYRRNITKVMRVQRSRNYRSKCVQRSHTYVGINTTQAKCIGLCRVFERKK